MSWLTGCLDVIMEQYDKYCDDYEENEDTETLANIEKYEDRLKYFIKK